MACLNTNISNSNSSNALNTNDCMYDTISRIDQMQKAASVQTLCEGCEGSLVSAFYNTKPISIYLCSGVLFQAVVPDTGATTTLFRIENVKGDCVTLRLLVEANDVTTCTIYTIQLKINCICGLQCFAPICCESCQRTCPTA